MQGISGRACGELFEQRRGAFRGAAMRVQNPAGLTGKTLPFSHITQESAQRVR